MQIQDLKFRQSSPALIFVLALLSFAVFSWGLQYKLSLYHAETATGAVPTAKLLSQRERPLAGAQFSRLRRSRPLARARRFPVTPAVVAATGRIELHDPTGDLHGRSYLHCPAEALRGAPSGPRAPPISA